MYRCSAYLHIPWCVQKCPYCDFNSHALKGKIPHQDYVDHLLEDLNHNLPLTSGSHRQYPVHRRQHSLILSSTMPSLVDGVRQRLLLAQDVEITMEANPSTVEADRFMAYQQAGINRMSISVQSFEPEKLAHLGHIHGAEEARRAANLAASRSACAALILI
ncbi:radical SAM protein [Sodalis-like endosymbiont of Proechinophthirus fluctus]|uniref:radical SAM protein n=1 Tax=Sodalis-like endosymbiont of Proechinophthirus fluctus TaxID=1462730 RepID=UPI003F74FD45